MIILLYLGIFIISALYCFLSLNLFKMWFALLQQNHYYNAITLKNIYINHNAIKRYFFILISITLLILLCGFLIINYLLKSANWYLLIMLILLGIYFYFYYFKIRNIKLKVPFKLTKRVIRLLVVYLFINFCLLFLVLYFSIIKNLNYLIFLISILFLMEGCLIIISNLICYPLEKLISYSYILKAKQKLKSYPNLIVIGITGSFGKTSTKNYLYQILKQKYNVLITPNSYNTPMGITKTILENLNSSHEIFIVEMGADHNNDIKKLCKIISPHFSIITSVGSQHLKTFKTIDNIINTKYQIVQYAKPNVKFFTNTDNKICKIYFDSSLCEKYDVGTNEKSYCKIENIVVGKTTSFNLKINNVTHNFKTKLLGKYNIYNIALSVCVALKLGVDIKAIKQAVLNLKPVKNRLELKTLSNGALLIDDSFNSNPSGAKQSLEVLSGFNKIKLVLTCGMVELGNKQFSENFEFGKNIASVADFVFIINKTNRTAIYNGLTSAGFSKEKIKCFDTFIEAFNEAKKITNENHIILIENDLPDNYN